MNDKQMLEDYKERAVHWNNTEIIHMTASIAMAYASTRTITDSFMDDVEKIMIDELNSRV